MIQYIYIDISAIEPLGLSTKGIQRAQDFGHTGHGHAVKTRLSRLPLSASLEFFVVWARILLCCLRRCLRNAYAARVGAYVAHPFEGVPMQAQRPCKATPQCTFLPTPSHFRLLLEGWKRNFCLRDHSPIHIFAKWDALRHPALPAAARDILQPRPCAAASPATRSQSAH